MKGDVGGMTNGERKAWVTLLRNLGDYFTEEGQLESCFVGGIELPSRQSMSAPQATNSSLKLTAEGESSPAGMQGRSRELPWERRPGGEQS